ncbi:hypothetical protein BBO99_00009818 [Phytophthora kernoviae]|uniref:Uncharacterized protein n=1 Tax=Phytophthora kernoviae TaxID=325452 RepID=A0A3R7GS39_9STRA|nr:hypothetical protein JM18_009822 [Phytophthora kernoviae]RLN26327.1 hypothetical protein BBI17_009882 [Phytophthora kernoviae]RLN72388.1 hypothetical protein BBO99_00009818 [Phytophthora kernoviae]
MEEAQPASSYLGENVVLSIQQVHRAWLAAGAKGDVETMRGLHSQHPQWLDPQRAVGVVSNTGTSASVPAPARSRFCSWESFHLSTVGASALHTAAWEGTHEIVGFLLEAGQDPDTSDDGGLTAMMVSLLRYNLVVMRCVFRNSAVAVRRNVVVDCREAERQLQNQVLAVVELLVRFGTNVDNRSQEGSSALHYVANSDALEVAKILLDAGADLDAQDQVTHDL